MKDRALQIDRFYVPEGVTTIITTVDVQGGKARRFELMVTGFGPDERTYPMDRFPITESKRPISEDSEDVHRIDPSSYVEDWDILIERANATFRLDEGQELMVHAMAIDCGGEAGVYETALKWYRTLSFDLKRKIYLVKGDALTVKQAAKKAKVTVTKPDSRKRSGAKVTSRGDVPILLINTSRFKDDIKNLLSRESEGVGYIQFPIHWKDHYYEELVNSEVKDPEKGWLKIRGKKNETHDLFCYAKALWHYIGGPKINWTRPPLWASPYSKNSNVVNKDGRQKVKARPYRRY